MTIKIKLSDRRQENAETQKNKEQAMMINNIRADRGQRLNKRIEENICVYAPQLINIKEKEKSQTTGQKKYGAG